jgi:septation ring formation regulator EzrA
VNQHHENEFLVSKMQNAKLNIISESLDKIDDSVVSKFMLYSTLRQELNESEGNGQ